jgi:hypothetical protein
VGDIRLISLERIEKQQMLVSHISSSNQYKKLSSSVCEAKINTPRSHHLVS